MSYFTEEKLENLLKGLPTYKIYAELEKDVSNASNFSTECAEVNSFEGQYPEVSKLCAKIAKNFQDFSNIKSMITSGDDHILYLIYWTYNAIRKFFISNFKQVPTHLSEKLLNVANKSYHKKHNKYIITGYSHNFFEKTEEKDLFDYFTNFDQLIINIKNDNYNCDKYCAYVAYIKEIYEKHQFSEKYDCCVMFDCDEDYFKCDAKYKPHDLLSELKNKFQATAKVNEKAVQPKINQQELSCPYSDQIRNSLGQCEKINHTPDVVQNPGKEDYRDSNPFIQTSKGTSIFANLFNAFYDYSENSYNTPRPNFFRISVVIILILGLFFLSSFYFKFNSLGSWFNKNNRGKNEFMYNKYEEDFKHLTHHDSNNSYINMLDERLCVAYYPNNE
ncbi:PIR protein [Plasmodium ovale]|uniref:PIR protein n=1 Tax=Plasmodium ovale TaxID=36330 RepID=A0A1D3JGQ2_PLAOA|nr:PIR protein [Plasmodium ovale]